MIADVTFEREKLEEKWLKNFIILKEEKRILEDRERLGKCIVHD